MKLPHLLLFLFCIVLKSDISAQEEISGWREILDNTTIWTELGGHGFAYSLGVEQFIINDVHKLSVQLAVAYYGKESGAIPLWAPFTVNQMLALEKDKHFIELGAGIMLNDDGSVDSNGVHTSNYKIDDYVFRLGYRLRNPDRKFTLRIAFTPIIQDVPILNRTQRIGSNRNLVDEFFDEMIPWAGIGFGWRL